MAREINKTTLGAFVVGALTLLASALLVLGSGNFWGHNPQFVLYFKGSVRGLNVGAPVVFRGVPIGHVSAIRLQVEKENLDFSIPVYIELEPGRIIDMQDGKHIANRSDSAVLDTLIEKGLRAQLTLQSFVTGQLMIEFNFFPGSPIVMRGDTKNRELPTLPSPMEELTRTLQNLPIENITAQINEAVSGLNRLVNSPVIVETASSLTKTLDEVRGLTIAINKQIVPVAHTVGGAAQRYGALAEKLDRQIPEVLVKTTETLGAVTAAAAKAEKALANASGVIKDDSRTMGELQQSLRELGGAARALRNLAEYLERHPEALLKGKGEYK